MTPIRFLLVDSDILIQLKNDYVERYLARKVIKLMAKVSTQMKDVSKTFSIRFRGCKRGDIGDKPC